MIEKGNIKPLWNDIAFFNLIFALRRPRHGKIDSGEHIFDKNSVSRGRVIDQHVGDCSHQLAVLDDRAAAHECVQVGTTVFYKKFTT